VVEQGQGSMLSFLVFQDNLSDVCPWHAFPVLSIPKMNRNRLESSVCAFFQMAICKNLQFDV
jgi:hypothetical protein